MMYTFTKAKAPRACTLSGLGSIRAFLSQAHAVNCGILQKVDFGLPPCEVFHSSRFGSGGPSEFSTDTTQKYLAEFRAVVLCQDLAYRTFAPVSRECTVSGLESILAFP